MTNEHLQHAIDQAYQRLQPHPFTGRDQLSTADMARTRTHLYALLDEQKRRANEKSIANAPEPDIAVGGTD